MHQTGNVRDAKEQSSTITQGLINRIDQLTQHLSEGVLESRSHVSRVHLFPPTDSIGPAPGYFLDPDCLPTICDQLETMVRRLENICGVVNETNDHLTRVV